MIRFIASVSVIALLAAFPAGAQQPSAGSGAAAQPLTGVGFLQLPTIEDLTRNYPAVASSQHVEGKAKFSCLVGVDGRLRDCVIVSETPPDFGFGAATLRITTLFQLKPTTTAGAPVAGRTWSANIDWELPR